MAKKTNLKDGKLIIDCNVLQIDLFSDYVEEAEIKIIKPHEHESYINTMIDIIPISTKVLGRIGLGITHTQTGAYFMLTGCDTSGQQLTGFGSSEGILKDQLIFGKAGSPNVDDFIIHVDVTIKKDVQLNQQVVFSIYQICDACIQDIRDMLKMKNGNEADERHKYIDKLSGNKTKVAIVKQVAGQGVMYYNLLFPNEPSGTSGGLSIIDMNNMPVILTPNAYRDGALRSLT